MIIPTSMVTTPVRAAEAISHEVDLNDYIVLDLGKGDITITATGYTGHEWTTAGEPTGSTTGTNTAKAYYIIQTNANATASVTDGILTTPAWQNISNISNQTDVAAVATAWDMAATTIGRTAVASGITVTPSNDMNLTVVLDDLWTTKQPTNATTANGGFVLKCSTQRAKVNVKLRGDNRMSKFYYQSNSGLNNEIHFDNFSNTDTEMGSLTVIGAQDKFYHNGSYISNSAPGGNGNVAYNNWASVMGGDDSAGQAEGFVFDGGCIYVGAGKFENCSAIGGGGNDYAKILITGGIVTAVAHTTGTAIGGGIGHQSAGGSANVTITGGTVYAYNFGVEAKDWVSNYGGATAEAKAAAAHIPGAAIGGGSSIMSSGNTGIVNISGGTVYAESRGGCAIGGGSSIVKEGGTGTVNISGGKVTARSTSGTISFKNGDFFVPASTAIGGGFSSMSTGGSTTVTISDGTIVSDGIGGGFSNSYGYSDGTVTITGGSLNSSMAAIPTDGTDNVYLTRVTFIDGEVKQVDKKLSEIGFVALADGTQAYADLLLANFISNFKIEHVYTDNVGVVYLWMPEEICVGSGKLYGSDTVYKPLYEDDDLINSMDIGALLTEGSPKQYVVNIAESEYFSLYFDENMRYPFSGSQFAPPGQFTCYIDALPGCTLTPYLEATAADGTKTLQKAEILTHLGDTRYRLDQTIYRDTRIWFMIDYNGVKSFIIDLTINNVSVTQADDGSLTIRQGEYLLKDYTGQIYLTSSGYPTPNQAVFNGPKDKTMDVYVNHVSANGSLPIIDVQSGNVNLTFGDSDNILRSTSSSPIYIEENAHLQIVMDGKDSVKLDGASGESAISGEGSLTIRDPGGFLMLNKGRTDAPNIAVGEYIYAGTNAKYTAVLHNGTYSFKIIGYINNLDGKLHDISSLPANNTTSFSARGILEAYTQVSANEVKSISNGTVNFKDTTTYAIDANGNLTLTLTTFKNTNVVGPVSVRPIASDTVTKIQDESTSYSVTITIGHEHFKDGHLLVMAAAKGYIAYTAVGFDGYYDGEEHTMSAEFDTNLFEISYSTSVGGVYNSTAPSYVNAQDTAYQIYFTIKPKDPSDTTYTPVTDSVKIMIRQAENYWVEPLKCPDIVVGETPSPSARAAFGTPVYSGDIGKVDTAKRCSITATVAETTNYTGLQSTVYFYVWEIVIYAEQGRKLDQLPPTTVASVNIAPNGIFTVYFASPISDEATTLHFSQPLPDNTKITMMEFLADGNVVYYQHTLTSEVTEILLSDFLEMGSTNTFLGNKEQSTYQFCLDFSETRGFHLPEGNKTVQMTLWNYSTSINVDLATHQVSFGNGVQSVSEEANTITLNFTPQILGPFNIILSVDVNADQPVDVQLFEQGKTTPIPLSWSNGNRFCFSLAESTSIVTNASYSVRIHATAETRVEDVELSLRLLDNAPIYPYVWANNYRGVTIKVDLSQTIVADTDTFRVNGRTRMIDLSQGSNMDLMFETNAANGETVMVTLLTKTPNGYANISGMPSIPRTVTNDQIQIPLEQLSGLAASVSEPIIVRLVFEYKGEICNYNLVIKPAT